MPEYKVVVLGSGGVGKSSLTVQFVQGIFVEKYDPTVEDSYRKPVEVDNQQYMLEILDTAGTEQFTAMRDLYMKNGQGFVLVYSIIAQSTFNDLPDLKEQILRVKDCDAVPMVLVGNNCDLEDQRVITQEQGDALARKFGGCTFLEVSARTKINVDAIFYDLIRQISAQSPTKPEVARKKGFLATYLQGRSMPSSSIPMLPSSLAKVASGDLTKLALDLESDMEVREVLALLLNGRPISSLTQLQLMLPSGSNGTGFVEAISSNETIEKVSIQGRSVSSETRRQLAEEVEINQRIMLAQRSGDPLKKLPTEPDASGRLILRRVLTSDVPLAALPFAGAWQSAESVDMRSNPELHQFPPGLTFLSEHKVKEILIDAEFLPDYEKSIVGTESGRGRARQILAAARLVSAGTKQVPLNQIKLIVLGDPAVGKTCLVRHLDNQPHLRSLNSTDGIDMKDVVFGDLTFTIYDFGGQRIYRFTHSLFLSSSAVYLILFKVNPAQWRRPFNLGPEEGVARTANRQALGELSFWMNSLMTKAPQAKVIFVGTHVDCIPPDQLRNLGNFIKECLQNRFVNQLYGYTNKDSIRSDVPWFCPISNSDGLNVAVLKENILRCGHDQVLRVPETVLAATKLTSNLLNDFNSQIPVVPMTEFLRRINNQDKPLSFASDVISVLEMLGLIFIVEALSSHGQQGSDQAPFFEPLVVFNPQWIADLLASIITTSHSWTRNGFFRYDDLPHIWTDVTRFPPSLWEEMLAILQKCHVIFPVPTTTSEQLPFVASSSIIASPASSLTIPMDDTGATRPRNYFVPCLLPSDPPDGLMERWWSKGTSTLFRRRSFLLEAGGSVLTIPDGFVPKLLIAMMSSPSLSITSLWQQGALCRSGAIEICLIRSTDQHLLHCGIYVPNFSSESATTSSEMARWLHFFSLIVSSLTTSDFQLPLREIIPCHINPLNGSMIDCFFKLKDLKRLAATGNQAQAICESPISNHSHPCRLDVICPDLLFADLSNSAEKANRFIFKPSDITLGRLLGEGAFGSVFQANLHSTTFSSAADDQQVALKFLANDSHSDASSSSSARTGSISELQHFMTLLNSQEFQTALSIEDSSIHLSKVGFSLCPPIFFMKATLSRKNKSLVDLEAWALRRFLFHCPDDKKSLSFKILTVIPPRKQAADTLFFALTLSSPEDLLQAIKHTPTTKKSLSDALGELKLALISDYQDYRAQLQPSKDNSVAMQCENFYDELRLMSSLSHPNIVHLLGVYIADSPAMVMELIPGGELYDQLDPECLLKLNKISSFFNFLRTLHSCSNMLFPKEQSLFRSPLPESHTLLEPWRTGPQQVFSKWTSYMKNHPDLKTVVRLHDRCSALAQRTLQGPLTRELDKMIQEFEEECTSVAVVHAKQFVTPITWKLRLKIALDIAMGMRYLHSLNPPLLHRDLKTPNVFLMHSLVQLTSSSSLSELPELPEVVAKIGDFGLSARLFTGRIQESSGNESYAGLINPRWVAPEILRLRFTQWGFSQKTTQSAYSLASDVYSYGIILWELLCRELPYNISVDAITGKKMPMAVDAIPDEVVRGRRPIIPEDCHPSYAQLVTQCWDNNPAVRPSFHSICGRLQEIAVELGIEGLIDPSPLASSSLTSQAAPNGSDPLAECVPHFESAFAFQSLESQITATGGRSSLRVESLTVDRTRTQIWIGFSNGAVACSQLQMHDMQRVIAPQFCRPSDAHSQRVSLLQSDATHVWTASPDGLLKVWLCHLPNSLVLLDNLQIFGSMQVAIDKRKKKLMWVDVQNLRIQCFADSKQGSPLLSLDIDNVTLSQQKDHLAVHYQEGKKARCLRLNTSSDSTDLALWYDKMISMQTIALDRTRLTQVTPCLIAQRKLPEKAQIWLMLQWQNQIFVVITDSGIRIVEWVLESGQQATGVRSFPIISPRRNFEIQIPPILTSKKLLPGACFANNNTLWVTLGTHLLVINAQLSHTSTSLSQVAFLPTRHISDISHLISIGDISSFRILSADLTGQLCIWKIGEGDLLEDEELYLQTSSLSSTPVESLPIGLSTQLNPPDPIFCMAKSGTRYVWGGARSGKVHIFSLQQQQSGLMPSVKHEQALAHHNAAITAIVPLIDNIIAVGSSDKSISFWRFAPQSSSANSSSPV